MEDWTTNFKVWRNFTGKTNEQALHLNIDFDVLENVL